MAVRSFLIDGEAVVADAQGVASFDLRRGRAHEKQAFVWAFGLLELDGEDLRQLPSGWDPSPEIDGNGICLRRSSISWVFAIVRIGKRSRFTLTPPNSFARPPWIL